MLRLFQLSTRGVLSSDSCLLDMPVIVWGHAVFYLDHLDSLRREDASTILVFHPSQLLLHEVQISRRQLEPQTCDVGVLCALRPVTAFQLSGQRYVCAHESVNKAVSTRISTCNHLYLCFMSMSPHFL